MGEPLVLLVVALTVAAVIFGAAALITGGDPGLVPAEPDGRAMPLPNDRPLVEEDFAKVRFDLALRGYRMAQVDQALRRAAYDIGYKDELIRVLEAEVAALREGRLADADVLRRAREAAAAPANKGTSAAASESTARAATASEAGEAASAAGRESEPAPVHEAGPSTADTATASVATASDEDAGAGEDAPAAPSSVAAEPAGEAAREAASGPDTADRPAGQETAPREPRSDQDAAAGAASEAEPTKSTGVESA